MVKKKNQKNVALVGNIFSHQKLVRLEISQY